MATPQACVVPWNVPCPVLTCVCGRRSTGWLTWWGQAMANSSIYDFLDSFDQILRYNNNMGSVTLYMGTGGTNFGYTAGARPGGRNGLNSFRCILRHVNSTWAVWSAVSGLAAPTVVSLSVRTSEAAATHALTGLGLIRRVWFSFLGGPLRHQRD